jgi:hypothetical protein
VFDGENPFSFSNGIIPKTSHVAYKISIDKTIGLTSEQLKRAAAKSLSQKIIQGLKLIDRPIIK